MAVAAFKSTTRRQWDVRGMEIELFTSVPELRRSIDASPTQNFSPTRRSISRNLSPPRRSTSKAPSLTRRRSVSKVPSPSRRRATSKAPSPTRVRHSMFKAASPTRGRRSISKAPSRTRRRSTSKAPSPTRGRRSISKAPSLTRQRPTSKAPSPSPTRNPVVRAPSPTHRPSSSKVYRSMAKAPSPTRRSMSRAVTPGTRARLTESVSRNPSPQRGERRVGLRGASPQRGRRAASRGPSPQRGRRGVSPSRQRGLSGTGGTEPGPASPPRRVSLRGGPRTRATSQGPAARPNGRVHRTTQSFADLSLPKYLAELPIVAEPRPLVVETRQSGIGLRSSHSSRAIPSDLESEAGPRYEAEPRYVRRLDRSFRVDSSDNESVQSSRLTASKKASGLRARTLKRTSSSELRRSLTHLEASDPTTLVYYQKPKPVATEEHRNDGEVQVEGKVEDKSIQEVHTQTKVHTLCYNCLYSDVSSSADAPSDPFSTSMGTDVRNNHIMPTPPDKSDHFATLSATKSADVIRRSISDARSVELEQEQEDDLRKVMELAKLELSERSITPELWSQYSSEERKGHHPVKSVKDSAEGLSEAEIDEVELEVTLPEEEDLKLPQQHRYAMDDLDDHDFIRQSVDEDAARYFEKCVITANFDDANDVADDISVCSDMRVSDGESSTVCEDLRPTVPSRRQSSDSTGSQEALMNNSSVKTKAIELLDEEGMLLPWLDWEPELDLGRIKERTEKLAVGHRKVLRDWKSAKWARNGVEWDRFSSEHRGRWKDEGVENVDEFLFERTRLQPRLSHGRMLVCGGKR